MSKWLEIKNSVANNTPKTELIIYGEIGDWWEGLDANTLAEAIRNAESDTIEIRMLTYGGSLVTALGVYNVMKASGKKFIIHNDGVIASAGTVIACAGEVHMPRNAMYMVHSALVGAYGNAEELRRIADMLDKFDGGIKSIYKDKTNLEDDVIDDLMSKDTWLNADEAAKLGLVDVVTEGIQIAASASGKSTIINGIELPKLDIKNLPNHLLNTVKSVNEPKNEVETKMDLAKLKAEYSDVAKAHADEVRADMQTQIEDAVKAERQRIEDINAATLPGLEALAQEAVTAGLSAGEFAIKALKAEKDKGADALVKMNADRAQATAPVATAPVVDAPVETEEDKLVSALTASL